LFIFQELDDRIKTLGYAIQEESKSYAFIAQRTSDFNSQNSIVPYTVVRHNGGSFNADSGLFVAPVDGIYAFSFNGLKMSEKRSNFYRLQLQLIRLPNGQPNAVQDLAGGLVDGYDPSHFREACLPVSMQATALLKKGDSVGVKLIMGWLHEPNAPYGTYMTTFTGYLVKTRL